jgi:NADH dehydrogenase
MAKPVDSLAPRQIVILGGGFGGVKAALELCEDARFRVTVVSNHPDFRYYPALYRSATGGARRISAIPLATLFEGKQVDIVIARAANLDRNQHTVHTGNGEVIDYDELIIALGVTTNYFGIKGLPEYSYGIKSIEEAEEFKAHIHQQMVEDKRPDLNYVVIGGGPTGVELAGALPQFIKTVAHKHKLGHHKVRVELIEAAPRILPRAPESISRATTKRLGHLGVTVRTSQKVEAETADALVVNGQKIQTETVVWTAGVTNNRFLQDNKFALSDHGKAVVDQYLRAEEHIFVIGDNADTPYSGVAQTALYDAKFVTDNLKRGAAGESYKTYKPRRPIYVTPTGPHWASVIWGKVSFVGRLGWWLRRAADWIGYHDLEPWWPASKHWMAEKYEEDTCFICANADQDNR